MSDRENPPLDRESIFKKRIADLGFERQQLPWQNAAAPQLNLPWEETRLYFEQQAEGALTEAEAERRVLLELLQTTYNFRFFYKRLHYELKRAVRYKRNLSLCLVGIDKYENYSAGAGVSVCEELLRSAARVILTSIRDVDIPGRCRDDTFGVILPETDLAGAEVAAERLRTKLEKHPIVHEWNNLEITASIGVACFPAHAGQLDELFANAAEAMLNAMQHGGNTVRFACAGANVDL